MRGRLRYLVAAALIAAFPLLGVNVFYLQLAQQVAFVSIAVLGLNLLIGLSGQLSLGHMGFYAIGGYGSAILATTYGWPLWASTLAGLLVAAIIGGLVGIVALRARSHYLAMATLAFGYIVEILAQRWIDLTGGTMGLFGVPQLNFGDFEHGGIYFFWLVAGALLLLQIVNDYVMQSAWGRNLRAMKESESFAAIVGLNVSLWRFGVFVASAVLAGLAGVFFVHQNGYISSDAFNLAQSLTFLIAVVIGGLGHPYGAIVGALILTVLVQFTAVLYDYSLVLYGGILLLVMLVYPGGAAGLLSGIYSRLRPTPKAVRVAANERAELDDAFRGRPGEGGAGESLLEIDNVTKRYAGVTAVNRVTTTVRRGTVHSLIGPNGAGKSSLINIISGLYAADGGRICFRGQDITGLPAHARARLGIARTFQNLQLIYNLSVLENVMLGAQSERTGFVAGLGRWFFSSSFEADLRRRALALLGFFGLAPYADMTPGDLSYGHRKLCELARAVMQQPTLMLLDEPIAGLNNEEAAEIADAVRRLRAAGITLLIVEHNMSFVMDVSDRITVLDYGEKIADGAPDEVRNDRRVIDAYLGVEAVE